MKGKIQTNRLLSNCPKIKTRWSHRNRIDSNGSKFEVCMFSQSWFKRRGRNEQWAEKSMLSPGNDPKNIIIHATRSYNKSIFWLFHKVPSNTWTKHWLFHSVIVKQHINKTIQGFVLKVQQSDTTMALFTAGQRNIRPGVQICLPH